MHDEFCLALLFSKIHLSDLKWTFTSFSMFSLTSRGLNLILHKIIFWVSSTGNSPKIYEPAKCKCVTKLLHVRTTATCSSYKEMLQLGAATCALELQTGVVQCNLGAVN